MPITDWPQTERPREKLLKYGVQALSEAELLAIFLRTGVKGQTAVDIARDLLAEFAGLRNILAADQKEFCSRRGLGLVKFVELQAIMEMSRRCLHEILKKSDVVVNSEHTKLYLTSRLRHYQREVFACLFLDTRHRIIEYEEIFYGTIDCANVHPREVVKRALQLNAAAVILAHNHPSGVVEASLADREITQRLIKALGLIDVRVLDHMIVGEGSVLSFAESGLIF
jgi:DNA repair protein RadC